jgi:hypothetical protein
MSSPILSPERALIFRITHRDNVPWILDHGLCAQSCGPLDPNFRNIGNLDLIGKRVHRRVPAGPGGLLSDYIPFYFTPFSIMMNDEIVILVSSLPVVSKLTIPFVFTDRHAYSLRPRYFTDLADLSRIDWPLLISRDFSNDPDDPEKKERYQAEALIWRQLPLEAVLGICCCSDEVREQVQAQAAERTLAVKVIMKRSWYF